MHDQQMQGFNMNEAPRGPLGFHQPPLPPRQPPPAPRQPPPPPHPALPRPFYPASTVTHAGQSAAPVFNQFTPSSHMQQPAQLQQSDAARPAAVAASSQIHAPLVHGGQSGAAHHLPSSSTLQLDSHTGQNLLVGQHQPRAALQLVNGNQLHPETSNKRHLEKPENDTQAAAMSQQRSLAQASSSASHSQVAHPQPAPSAAVASTSGLHDSTPAEPPPASFGLLQPTPSVVPAAPCAPSSVPSSVPSEPDAGPPGFPRFAPSRPPAGPPGLAPHVALGTSGLQSTGQMLLEDENYWGFGHQQQHDWVGEGQYYEQEGTQVCDRLSSVHCCIVLSYISSTWRNAPFVHRSLSVLVTYMFSWVKQRISCMLPLLSARVQRLLCSCPHVGTTFFSWMRQA